MRLKSNRSFTRRGEEARIPSPHLKHRFVGQENVTTERMVVGAVSLHRINPESALLYTSMSTLIVHQGFLVLYGQQQITCSSTLVQSGTTAGHCLPPYPKKCQSVPLTHSSSGFSCGGKDIASIILTAKSQKLRKCGINRMDKLWSINKMKYYTAMKMKPTAKCNMADSHKHNIEQTLSTKKYLS